MVSTSTISSVREVALSEKAREQIEKLIFEAQEVSRGAGSAKTTSKRQPKQADVLVDLTRGVDLFHSPDGTAYGDVSVDGTRQTLAIRSSHFKNWIGRGWSNP